MRILIAEDDHETAEFIRRGLSELGHNRAGHQDGLGRACTCCWSRSSTSRSSTGCCRNSTACRWSGACARRKIETPVLLLTALGRIQDRVDGPRCRGGRLSGQAVRLFRTRGAGQCARPAQTAPGRSRPPLEHRGICRRPSQAAGRTRRRAVQLQPREFRILEELMREAGRVVTRTMLLERVWNYHFDPQTNIVDTHISRLRAKLNEGGRPDADRDRPRRRLPHGATMRSWRRARLIASRSPISRLMRSASRCSACRVRGDARRLQPAARLHGFRGSAGARR